MFSCLWESNQAWQGPFVLYLFSFSSEQNSIVVAQSWFLICAPVFSSGWIWPVNSSQAGRPCQYWLKSVFYNRKQSHWMDDAWISKNKWINPLSLSLCFSVQERRAGWTAGRFILDIKSLHQEQKRTFHRDFLTTESYPQRSDVLQSQTAIWTKNDMQGIEVCYPTGARRVPKYFRVSGRVGVNV